MAGRPGGVRQGSCRPGARPEQAKREISNVRYVTELLHDHVKPSSEASHVEPVGRTADVRCLFAFTEKVHQERREPRLLQAFGDMTIPGTVATAATAMHEHDEALRLLRNDEVAKKRLFPIADRDLVSRHDA